LLTKLFRFGLDAVHEGSETEWQMETSNTDKRNGDGKTIAPEAAPAKSKKSLKPTLEERLLELMNVGGSLIPIWVRAPVSGPEHYSGFTRAKLYQLAGQQKIRSVSTREPGQVKGCRLFNLRSILEFIERCEKTQVESPAAERGAICCDSSAASHSGNVPDEISAMPRFLPQGG
jgi:hypothetical protein